MATRHEIDQRVQAVLDALPAHIAVLDENGTIIAVNAAWRCFAHANGYAGAECGLGVNYLDICWQASGPEVAEARAAARGIRAVLADAQAEFCYDYACHGPDEQRWFQLRAAHFAGDRPIGAIVTHVDITGQKQREATSFRTEAAYRPSSDPVEPSFEPSSGRLQALFDLAQDAFLLADDQSRFIDGNAAACKLTGYSRSELLRLERRQLARELHDQIGQSLAVLNVNLSITRNQLSSESAVRVDARLVQAFGGRLLIEAAPGQGTRIVAEVSG